MTARPSRPQALPEYRNAAVDNVGLWVNMRLLTEMTGKRDFQHEWHLHDEMERARLWWIGADACDLIEQAAPTMPPATLTTDFAPDECGFVFFDRPIVGLDAENPEVTIAVDALLWFPTLVGRDEGYEVDALSIIAWQHNDVHPMALGRSDWPYDWDTDRRLPGQNDLAHASVMEDRRLLACIWQLSSQAGLTETVDQPVDRSTYKRLVRAQKAVPDVRLVNIAAHRRGPSDGDSGGSGRTYTRRWVVEGHWRQQACGPQWSQRRPVFIAPHVKGPDDAPLVVPDTVKVWR